MTEFEEQSVVDISDTHVEGREIMLWSNWNISKECDCRTLWPLQILFPSSYDSQIES